MESAWQITGEDEKRQLALAEIAKQAAELVHRAAEAKEEVAEIERVLAGNDHVRMWETLQKYLGRYLLFIVGTSPFTNITIVALTKETMRIMTSEVLRHQLQLVIGFVYAFHALNGPCKLAFQSQFSKLTRNFSG